MARVRRQELQHPLVGAALLAGQRPAHGVAEVEVPDADGVRVPQRAQADFGGRPLAHERQGAEPPVGVRQRHRRALLHAAGVRRGNADRVGSPPLQPERVVGVPGEAGQHLRRGGDTQRGRAPLRLPRPGRRLAVTTDEGHERGTRPRRRSPSARRSPGPAPPGPGPSAPSGSHGSVPAGCEGAGDRPPGWRSRPGRRRRRPAPAPARSPTRPPAPTPAPGSRRRPAPGGSSPARPACDLLARPTHRARSAASGPRGRAGGSRASGAGPPEALERSGARGAPPRQPTPSGVALRRRGCGCALGT